MKKKRANAGETLVETLFSLVIISLAMLLMAGAIIAAARVNGKARDTAVFLSDSASSEAGVAQIDGEEIEVTVYSEEGRLYYYEP